jgi:hypothetical protein
VWRTGVSACCEKGGQNRHKLIRKSSMFTNLLFLISSFRRVLYVVCFVLGNYPAFGVYMPTFRNTLLHLHRQVDGRFYSHLPAYEDGTECSETSAYNLQTAENYPKESVQTSCFSQCLLQKLIKLLLQSHTTRHTVHTSQPKILVARKPHII